MIILPIWLWLVLFAIALIVTIVSWAKKTLVDKPKSARAVEAGVVIPDSQLESGCRSAILDRELTAPGQTRFVSYIQPLEFKGAGDRARTPISLVLSERTLGVSYKKGSLGNTITILIDQQDIRTGYADPAQGGLSYSVETTKVQCISFRLQSQNDLNVLASWIQAGQRQVGNSAQ